MSDTPTERFSHTVENYIRYRPGYPVALLVFMKEQLGLLPHQVIADIGSGTGKLAALLLENGNRVYGVEPNGPMRVAAENLLAGNDRFISIDGKAEDTGLPDQSVHFVTAGQAFHWFDVGAFQKECRRILHPGGWVLLIWNNMADEEFLFMQAYESFLQRYSTDYAEVNHRRIGPRQMDGFFGVDNYPYIKFDNAQVFSFEGLLGRYESCSYALPAGHPDYGEAVRQLKRLFERYQEEGKVIMAYNTEVYYGRISESVVT